MTDTEPGKLADQLEEQADALEHRSEELGSEVKNVREDWERKRADDSVPGAPPREEDEPGEDVGGSPAPQAPPEGAAPSRAETPPEGGAGPPADVIDDSGSGD